MRTIMQSVLLTCMLLLPRVCAAQGQSGSTLSGPTMGLMFDSAAAVIRPILGIPGAATLGTPLDPGFAFAQVVVAPGGEFALVVEKHGFRMAIVRASGEVVRNLTPAMSEAPDLIEFSPGGASAAVYYRISGRLLVLTGLNGPTPRVGQADTSTLPAPPSLLAVSEDASSLLLTVSTADTAAVYLLPNAPSATRQTSLKGFGGMVSGADAASEAPAVTGVARRVGNFRSITALRFAGSGHDAIVAEGTTNTVYLIQNASGAAQISALGSAGDGLSRPVAIEALDARRVLVANAGSDKLTMLYRDGTPSESIACGCSAVVLHQLAGTSVYRLTEPSNGPMWLLDAGGREARILAVPPDHSQTASTTVVEGAQR